MELRTKIEVNLQPAAAAAAPTKTSVEETFRLKTIIKLIIIVTSIDDKLNIESWRAFSRSYVEEKKKWFKQLSIDRIRMNE